MWEEMQLNFATSKLEELRCSICKGYLSSSPIRLLPDGNCICGSCTPVNCKAPAVRVMQFEAVLSEVLFPCQFMKNGCTKKLLFGSTTDHESTCNHRMVACPTLKSCAWEGISSQLHVHLTQMHADLIKEKLEFKFELNQDVEELLTFVKEGLLFILKYQYKESEKSLMYDIRCSLNTEHDLFYTTRLSNGSNLNCNFNMKLSKCFPFDDTFYAMQKAVTLKLNTLLEVLEFPAFVVTIINLQVVKAHSKNAKQGKKPTRIVNYDLLETVRCLQCKNYLIAPLFTVPTGTVCYDCSKCYKKPKPVLDTKLKALVAKLNYPCQWHGCTFVGKGEEIKIHRLSCWFRSYKCFASNCNVSLNLASVATHVQKNHDDAEYSLKYMYKTSFALPYWDKYAYTIKDNTLLTVRHSVLMYYPPLGGFPYIHHSVFLFSDLTEIKISIQFEHQHCKLKSKPFILLSNKSKAIDLIDLPACFSVSDELSVTVCDPQKKTVPKKIKLWWLLIVALVLFLCLGYYFLK